MGGLIWDSSANRIDDEDATIDFYHCPRCGYAYEVYSPTEEEKQDYKDFYELETLQLINLSTQGKATMSQEDGIMLNPLVPNPEETKQKLREEEAQAAKLNLFATAAQNTEE